MNKNLHDIDQIFKDGAGDYSEMPSDKVWENIELALNKKAAPVQKTFFDRNKKYAAVLLLLLISTCSYFVFKNDLQSPLHSSRINNTLDTLKAANKNITKNAIETTIPIEDSIGKNKTLATEVNKIKTKNGVIEQNKVEMNTETLAQENKIKSFKNTIEFSKKTKVKNNNDENEEVAVFQKTNTNKHEKLYKKQYQVITTSGEPAESNEVSGEPVNTSIDDISITESTNIERPNKFIAANKLNDFAKPDFVLPSNINSIYKNIKSSTKKVKVSNSSLFVFYEPQINFSHLKENKDKHDNSPQPGPNPGGGQSPNGERKKEFEKDESKQKSLAFGAIFSKQIGSHFSLISGATYFNKSIDILPKKIFAKLDDRGEVKYKFECSTGYTYIASKSNTTIAVGDSIVTNASKNVTDYLCIPVGVGYSFNVSKFTIVPSIGASANFLLHQSIKTSFDQGVAKYEQESKDIFGLKSNYFSGFSNVNINYNLNKKIAITVAPSINFGLNSINKNTAVKAYNNTFGVRFGTTINF